MDPVQEMIQPDWPPLHHIRRGWNALHESEQQTVQKRLDTTLKRHTFGDHEPVHLQHFFTFLAQVETIAIEIPLRFLPVAPPEVQPLLRAQLVDEVFHSVLFARLAHELTSPVGPNETLASADALLNQIRAEDDLSISAAMLNLVAEGWIETLFRHAAKWNIAPAVFAAVLEDESRHVEEASQYLQEFDGAKAVEAVHRLEAGFMELSAEPVVSQAMLQLAGYEKYREFIDDLRQEHAKHLEKIAIEPSEIWQTWAKIPLPDAIAHEPVDSGLWRQTAAQIWQAPTSPTLLGSMDLQIGHIPKRLLTPVLVQAVATAWHEHPDLCRIIHRNKLYQLPNQVGVRVVLESGDLATVIIRDGHKYSVRDIGKLLQDGLHQLESLRSRADRVGNIRDSMAIAPPEANQYSVALSNAGKFGLEHGTGAFTGEISPSTDLTIGERQRRPTWKGIGYFPTWHVTLGALQDHRVFDADGSGLAMRALRKQLSRKGVRALLRRPDQLGHMPPRDFYDRLLPTQLHAMGAVSLGKYAPAVIAGATAAAAVGALTGFGIAYAMKERCSVDGCDKKLENWACPDHPMAPISWEELAQNDEPN